MKEKDIEIRVVNEWPEDEIVQLYKSGGWWKDSYDDPSNIQKLIQGSFVFAVAVESNSGKAVGMGRLISDGVSDAYIQDLVVLPKYREQGIGNNLVKALLRYALSKGLTWLGLIAEPGQDNFYLSLNFKHMKHYIPMKYEKM